jgi:hypothetical protein
MAEAPARTEFRHCVLSYQDPADSLTAVLAFVRDGLARRDPVSIAVSGPAGDRTRVSADYPGPGVLPPECDYPLGRLQTTLPGCSAPGICARCAS